jgi:hypothetical protein
MGIFCRTSSVGSAGSKPTDFTAAALVRLKIKAHTNAAPNRPAADHSVTSRADWTDGVGVDVGTDVGLCVGLGVGLGVGVGVGAEVVAYDPNEETGVGAAEVGAGAGVGTGVGAPQLSTQSSDDKHPVATGLLQTVHTFVVLLH